MHSERSLAMNPHDYKRYTIVMCRHHSHFTICHPTNHLNADIFILVEKEFFTLQSFVKYFSLLLIQQASFICVFVHVLFFFCFISLKYDFFGSSRHIAQNNNNICICIHICILYQHEQRQLRFISKTK